MTLEECKLCGMIYYGSGFFTSPDQIPEEMKLLDSLTRQQHLRVSQVEPESSYICGYCYVDAAKRFGILDPCTLPPAGYWCSRGPGHDGPCAAREEPIDYWCHKCNWDKFKADGWCLCPKEPK